MITFAELFEIKERAKDYRKQLEEMIVEAETETEVENYSKGFMCYADGITTAVKAVKANNSPNEDEMIKELIEILAEYQTMIKVTAGRKIGYIYNSNKENERTI